MIINHTNFFLPLLEQVKKLIKILRIDEFFHYCARFISRNVCMLDHIRTYSNNNYQKISCIWKKNGDKRKPGSFIDTQTSLYTPSPCSVNQNGVIS